MKTSNVSVTDLWVVRPQRLAAPRVRVFSFPYAGGGPAAFRPWARALPPDVELCIVHLPGREGRWREPAAHHLTALVAPISEALRPLLDVPYVFYGHSLGTLVAFEVARHLRRAQGTLPQHFVGSAHRAPQLRNPHPEIRHLTDDEFVAAINQRYGGIPQAVLDNRELLDLMLPSLRADFSVYETYEYRDDRALECPMSMFGGDRDAYVLPGEIEAWRVHTTGRFRHAIVPGDHFFIQSRRDVVLSAVLEGTGAAELRV